MKQDTWQYWYPRKEGTIEPEIPKLTELLARNHASTLLDFGCGAGRHTVYFAKKGFHVYGFDGSAAAIEQAIKILSAHAKERPEDRKARIIRASKKKKKKRR